MCVPKRMSRSARSAHIEAAEAHLQRHVAEYLSLSDLVAFGSFFGVNDTSLKIYRT